MKLSRSEIDTLVYKENWERIAFDKQSSVAQISEIDDNAILTFIDRARNREICR